MRADEVCQHAGISFRQLDTWTRSGLLELRQAAAGSGVPREWSREEAEVAKVMKRLIGAGLTLQLAAKLARMEPGEHRLSDHVLVTVRP